MWSILLVVTTLLFQLRVEATSLPPFQNGNVLPLVQAKEILVIGKKSGQWILNAQGVVPAAGRSFIVSDKLDYKLKRFDRSGRIIAQAGKRGNGPGEFRAPGPIASYQDKLIVADFASPRVQVFTQGLEYRSMFYAPGPVVDMSTDNGGNIWIGALTGSARQFLYKVDPGGEVKQKIQLRSMADNEFDQLLSFCIDRAGEIIVAYAYRNEVEIYDQDGNLKKEFEVPGIPLRPKKKVVSRGLFSKGIEIPEDCVLRSVAVDSQHRIFVLADEYTTNPGRDVYALDNQGKLLLIVTLSDRSSRIEFGPGDELYSIEQNRTAVKVYELRTEHKKNIHKGG